ncbi:MAG: ribose ABC transporter [Alphaproteobacteria bacterium]|nr:ribose ABC transporter [Alphaproteobacteria bacterium]
MLKGIDPLLGPELLHVLASMGHGDEIAVVDANFPAAAVARRLVRLESADAPRALQAILTLLPLDTFVAAPAASMQPVGDPAAVPPPVRDFQALLDAAAGRRVTVAPLDRFAFYERVKAAYAVVATGERRFYGNVILVKGVIDADGRVPPPRDPAAGAR